MAEGKNPWWKDWSDKNSGDWLYFISKWPDPKNASDWVQRDRGKPEPKPEPPKPDKAEQIKNFLARKMVENLRPDPTSITQFLAYQEVWDFLQGLE